MRAVIKKALLNLAPALIAPLLAIRARRYSHRLIREWKLDCLNEKLIHHFGNRVLDGPFAGMTLPSQARNENLGPFLAGTYEAELHSFLSECRQRRFDQIVDVGCSFGYYAVGLARMFPAVPVIAFDIDPWARATTREMASLNSARNVVVRGACTPAWLGAKLGANALIVCDCEGHEGHLLTTRPIPSMSSAVMIIELHESQAPGVTDALTRKLASTHALQVVKMGVRHLPERIRSELSESEARSATYEIRGEQSWLCAVPLEH